MYLSEKKLQHFVGGQVSFVFSCPLDVNWYCVRGAFGNGTDGKALWVITRAQREGGVRVGQITTTVRSLHEHAVYSEVTKRFENTETTILYSIRPHNTE